MTKAALVGKKLEMIIPRRLPCRIIRGLFVYLFLEDRAVYVVKPFILHNDEQKNVRVSEDAAEKTERKA